MNKEIILCVDDEAIILMSLKQELKKDPFFADIQIETAENGEEALKLLQEINADGDKVPVIISDQRMPLMPGDEFLIRAAELVPKTLKILLTGYSDLDAVVRLVNNNVLYRYLVKPWNRHDLGLTIKEACRTFQQQELIRQQASRIEHLTLAMVSALESANLFFDEDTGMHIMRIARLSAFIAEKSGLPQRCIHHIEMYAPLHDIGKVGVAKEILQKPGKLSSEEFAQIQEHVRIGHRIIDNTAIDECAKNIVLYHHEKWNGSGYPEGLKGEAIPLEARIVSIADVLDALASKRVYKPPYSLSEAIKILESERGKSFDPHLIDTLLAEIDPQDSYQLFLQKIGHTEGINQ